MTFVPVFEVGMWNAWIFTIWLLIQTLAIRLVSKNAYQRFENPADMKASQAYRIVSYLSMPLWILVTAYSIFLPLKLGTIWFIIGLIVFLSGLFILVSSTLNFAATPMNEPITRGVYRYSRHPIYVSHLLIYLSVSIASVSWIFLLFTFLWVIMIIIAAKDEELYCLEKFGATYGAYMNRTPRWIGIPKS